MSKVFIIAEAACTWLHGGLEAAFRSIRAAKECGADAWKSQWTSDHEAMAMRRGVERDKYRRLGWSADALPKLKEECDRVGIEFMCTVFIEKDIKAIAQYVSRLKISAFEASWQEFYDVCCATGLQVIRSCNTHGLECTGGHPEAKQLWCVSKYPTDIMDLSISTLLTDRDWESGFDGISDHTTSLLSGAVAVGTGNCRILEKHVKMIDTPSDDPDFGHSLLMEMRDCEFKRYVNNIREAERML